MFAPRPFVRWANPRCRTQHRIRMPLMPPVMKEYHPLMPPHERMSPINVPYVTSETTIFWLQKYVFYVSEVTTGKDSEAGDMISRILTDFWAQDVDFGQIPDNCISRTAGGPESPHLHSVVFRMFADGFWQSGRPFQLVFEYAILQNSTSWTQDDQHNISPKCKEFDGFFNPEDWFLPDLR